MKKFIKEYLKIIATTLTGLVFIIASFYLMMNYNHSEEIKKTIYISGNDVEYQEIQKLLNKIEINLNSFKNTSNKDHLLMYNSLVNCYNIMQDTDTLYRIKPGSEYTATDIYNLGTNFQSKIISSCYNKNLEYLQSDNVPKEYKSVSPFITSYVNSINENVSDSLAEIQNNSSYFYTTSITSDTIRNYIVSDYNTIVNAYMDFAKIILNLSEQMNGKEITNNESDSLNLDNIEDSIGG